MFKKPLSALTAVLLLTLGTGSARADHLTVAFAIAKPPFVYQTETGAPRPGEAKGIELDIVKAALAPRGHTFTPLFTTYDGLQGEVLTGAADAAATVRPDNPALHYSTEVVYFHTYAILPKDAPAPAKIEDRAIKSMVAWEGATKDLGPIFAAAAAKSPDYAEMGDQKAQVAAFIDGRFDALIIDGTIFRYWAKVLGKNAGAYALHPLFGGRTPFVVGFADAGLRDDFNAGLKEIRQNGVYGVLFNHHIAD